MRKGEIVFSNHAEEQISIRGASKLEVKNKMLLKYDPKVDAAYLMFKKAKQVTTIQLSEEVSINLGEEEEVVGLEILDASKFLNFSKKKPTIRLENITPIIGKLST